MPSCLFVRPAFNGDPKGGDSVVYKRVEAYLGERTALTVLPMQPASRARQLLKVAAGRPLEPARYETAANQNALNKALSGGGHDVVIYGHEAVFGLGMAAPRTGRRVFYAHNILSGVHGRDGSLIDSLIAPATLRFDRSWTADPEDRLVCISRHDIASLRRIGVARDDLMLAAPGAPPAAALRADAGVILQPVLTGSYGWWRKRKDLKRFAAEPPLPWRLSANDATALEILGDQAEPLDSSIDWSAGLRPAVVTDRFLGGFKLKTLEYVALNCAIFTFSDLRPEFDGLPHADEFVRLIRSKAELGTAIQELAEAAPGPLLDRFRAFKAACLERYDWDRCLAPLGDTVS